MWLPSHMFKFGWLLHVYLPSECFCSHCVQEAQKSCRAVPLCSASTEMSLTSSCSKGSLLFPSCVQEAQKSCRAVP
eukprot:1137092-Pelagomonas_calceolata.AAC.4